MRHWQQQNELEAEDFDKENEIPELSEEDEQELHNDEPEMMDIYEDSTRRMTFLSETPTIPIAATPASMVSASKVSTPQVPASPKVTTAAPRIVELLPMTVSVVKQHFADVPILSPLPPPPPIKIEVSEDDEPKVSVRELIGNFELQKEKVHVRTMPRIIKESSSESDTSSEGKQ